MPKFTCYNCRQCKKGKFFPVNQPYNNKLACDKCINKNTKSNELMIKMLEQRTKQTLTDAEKTSIKLSIDASSEMKEVGKDNPKISNILREVSNCTDTQVIRENLESLGLTDSTLEELTAHFYVVASVNKRAQVQNANSTIIDEKNNTDDNTSTGDKTSTDIDVSQKELEYVHV